MLSYPRWRIDLFYAQLLLDDAMLLDSIPSVPDQPRSMIKKLHIMQIQRHKLCSRYFVNS
jgi:hypothetical protein